jgi:hypothetical protein
MSRTRSDSAEQRSADYHTYAMLALMASLCLFGFFLGDRIPVSDGFGWDGILYAQVAANPGQALLHHGVNSYHWAKVLPSLLVHWGLLASGTPITPPSVVTGFMLLNTAMLLLGTWFYSRLATFLQLSPAGRWLGFCFLFLNLNAIKVPFYYAVLGDTSALVTGLVLTYFYLTRQTAALAVTTLLASFTWGTALVMGATLLLFPASVGPRWDQPGLQPTGSPVPRLLAALIALGAAARLYYLYAHEGVRAIGYGPLPLTVESVYPLSLLCTTLYIYALFAWFFPLLSSQNVVAAWRSLSWQRAALTLAVALPVKSLSALLAKGVYPFTVALHFQMVTLQSATRPAVWLVAHFLALGPVVAFVPLVWSRTLELLGRWGPGAVLFTVLTLMTLIAPESRHSVFGYPFLVVAMVVVLDRSRLVRPGLAWSMGLLSLGMSRFWQRFHTGQSDATGGPDLSRYFATQGMQLPNPEYLTGLVALLVLAGALWLYARLPRRSEPL